MGATAPAYIWFPAASQTSRLDLISVFLKGQRRARMWWSKAFPDILQLKRGRCWAVAMNMVTRCTVGAESERLAWKIVGQVLLNCIATEAIDLKKQKLINMSRRLLEVLTNLCKPKYLSVLNLLSSDCMGILIKDDLSHTYYTNSKHI